MDLREILWAEAEDRLFITKEQFFARLDGWKVEGIYQDGDLACITMINGPEFHLHLTGKCKNVTMAQIREVCQPIIDEHGYMTTRTPVLMERQHRFNKIFGFEKTGEDEFFVHYRLEKIGGHRRNTCP